MYRWKKRICTFSTALPLCTSITALYYFSTYLRSCTLDCSVSFRKCISSSMSGSSNLRASNRASCLSTLHCTIESALSCWISRSLGFSRRFWDNKQMRCMYSCWTWFCWQAVHMSLLACSTIYFACSTRFNWHAVHVDVIPFQIDKFQLLCFLFIFLKRTKFRIQHLLHNLI